MFESCRAHLRINNKVSDIRQHTPAPAPSLLSQNPITHFFGLSTTKLAPGIIRARPRDALNSPAAGRNRSSSLYFDVIALYTLSRVFLYPPCSPQSFGFVDGVLPQRTSHAQLLTKKRYVTIGFFQRIESFRRKLSR